MRRLVYRDMIRWINKLPKETNFVQMSISTSCSNVQEPQSSGNGEFVVEDIFLTEDISIVASKNEYTTNADKIRTAQVFDLMNAPQEERDIPLIIALIA